MRPAITIPFALIVAMVLSPVKGFVLPSSSRGSSHALPSSQSASASLIRPTPSTSRAFIMPPVMDKYQRFKDLEKDSERWFEVQAGREARGELELLENPAFYGALFVFTPLVILIGGALTGIIPGFVDNRPDLPEFNELPQVYQAGVAELPNMTKGL